MHLHWSTGYLLVIINKWLWLTTRGDLVSPHGRLLFVNESMNSYRCSIPQGNLIKIGESRGKCNVVCTSGIVNISVDKWKYFDFENIETLHKTFNKHWQLLTAYFRYWWFYANCDLLVHCIFYPKKSWGNYISFGIIVTPLNYIQRHSILELFILFWDEQVLPDIRTVTCPRYQCRHFSKDFGLFN